MPEREWTARERKLRFAASGDSWFGKGIAPSWTDPIFDVIDTPLQRLLCWWYGHAPQKDQCLNPEHDYCSGCGTSLPYEAHGVEGLRWKPVEG